MSDPERVADPDYSDRTPLQWAQLALAETINGTSMFEEAVMALADCDDFDGMLSLLHEATHQLNDLNKAVGGLHDRVWAKRGDVYGDYPHPDLGTVSVRRTGKRTRWDHEGITTRVIEQLMEETGGEIPPPAVVVGRITDAAHVDYWRLGKLKEQGIDVKDEDLVWSEPGSPSISFPSQR